MSAATSTLSDSDFIYGYLTEYLDGELQPQEMERYDRLLKSLGEEATPVAYQAARGRLQLTMQSYYLKEADLQALHGNIIDPEVQDKDEQLRIAQLSRKETFGVWRRRTIMGSIIIGLLAYLGWSLWPVDKVPFRPLEFFGWEAVAMIENPMTRLDLPTSERSEVINYLQNYPGAEFVPPVLETLGDGWAIEGTAMFNYDLTGRDSIKVAVVQYINTDLDEKMFHFSYPGSLADLPSSEPGNIRGLIYQTYTSDDLNIIAWQHTSGVVSMLTGFRSAPEMAELAIQGGGI